MNHGRTRRIFLALCLACLMDETESSAQQLIHPWRSYDLNETGLQLGARIHYLGSDSNWGITGQTIRPENYYYQRLGSDLTLSAPWNDSWAFFARLSFSGVEGASAEANSSGLGFADQTIGVQYRFVGPWNLKIRPQIQADFPLYHSSPSDRSLGDGTLDLTTGLFISYPVPLRWQTQVELEAGTGFTYRTAFYSAEVPWQLGLKIKVEKLSIQVQTGLLGLASLKTDPHTYSPQYFRENLGTDRSLFSGAMNPSWMQAYLQLGYQLPNQMNLNFAIHHAIWGQMAPQFTGFSAAFQIPLLGNEPEKAPPLSPIMEQSLSQSQKEIHLEERLELQAKVIKSNERFNLIKIDRGQKDGVKLGDHFQIFSPFDLTHQPIALAKVTHLKVDQSALEIIEYFKDQWASEGNLAKRVNQAKRQNVDENKPSPPID